MLQKHPMEKQRNALVEEDLWAPFLDVDLNYPNPWGLPDWRNGADYAHMATLNQYEWKWEFVRRTDQYRNLWLEMQEARLRTGDPEVIGEDKYVDRSYKISGMALLGPQFDCREPVIAALLHHESILDFRAHTVRPSDEQIHERLQRLRENRTVLLQVNLDRPLGPQLERFANSLKLASSKECVRPAPPKRSKRKRLDKHVVYARLLDARSSSASWREITSVMAESVREFAVANPDFDVTMDAVRRAYRQAVKTQASYLGPPSWLEGYDWEGK
jgi:hypothetical protein